MTTTEGATRPPEPVAAPAPLPVELSEAVARVSHQPRVRPVWWGILALAVLTGYFVATESNNLYTYNFALLAVFGAVALNLLVGTTGIISLGNSAFMAIGAFASVFATSTGIPFPLNVVAAGAFTALAGAVIGLPAARLRGFHMALATMGGFFIVIYLANLYQARSEGGGGAGFFVDSLYMSKGLNGSQAYWAWTILGLVAVLLLGATRIDRERSGRAMRMIRDHEIVAHTMGIPVFRYRLMVFSLTSFLIGVEGALLVHLTGNANAESFTLHLAISYLAMVLIGGLDSVAGSVVGALAVTSMPLVVPDLMRSIIGEEQAVANGPALSLVAYGLLLILFIAVSPDGLVGVGRKIWGRVLGLWRRSADTPVVHG